MAVQITVFKSLLEDKKDLSHQLTQLSQQVQETDNACIYAPLPGRLMNIISLLDSHRVPFGIHSDSELRLDE